MRIRTMRFSLLLAGASLLAAGGCFRSDPGDARTGEAALALAPDGFSAAEWSVIQSLSPLPAHPPPDTTNKYADNPQAAELGHRIFFDKRVAGPILLGNDGSNGQLGNAGDVHKIACSDCHMPSSGWLFDVRSNGGNPQNPHATGLGATWMSRNVSSIVNTTYYIQGSGRSAPHWRENDGFSDSEWFDAQSEPEGFNVQNGSRLQLAHLLWDKYKSDYDQVFGAEFPLDPALDPAAPDAARFPATGLPGTPEWDGMAPGDQEKVNRILANYGKAMEAYLRTLISRDAPFDAYVAGDKHAISTKAKRGLKLFIGKAGCVACHNTPLFSDDDFHSTGLAIDTARSPHADPNEVGRYANEAFILGSEFNVDGPYSDDPTSGRLSGFQVNPADQGKWRTKSLRHVAKTAPYMRDGQLISLAEVIEFYDRGGDPAGTFAGGPKEIQPLHLSHQEKEDLEAFLESLTGQPLPAALIADTHRP